MTANVVRPLAWLTAGLSLLATTLAVGAYRSASASGTTPDEAPKPHATSEQENPAVAPGLVKWHKSAADAQAAAHKSGRPVLLFHMMGRLDKQFC